MIAASRSYDEMAPGRWGRAYDEAKWGEGVVVGEGTMTHPAIAWARKAL